MKNSTFFISDVHLDPAHPEITAIFIKFLQAQAPKADALYILGDFFEVWIGDDAASPLPKQIAKAINALTQHIPVYFMHGNRDFLIGKQFLAESGCQFLPDPSVITLYGKPILLTHGDRLCTQDQWHMLFRFITQQPWVKKAFLRLPLSLRQNIADTLRQKSKKRTGKLDMNRMDVALEAVIKDVKDHKTQLMVHGHTHKPAIHELTVGNETAYRIVLGAWHETGNALRYDDDHNYELITINP